MTGRAQEWQRVKGVLADALDLDASERAEFVRRECAGDDELCARVLALLELEETETQPVAWSGRPLTGRSIGNYLIGECIGRGGVGEVYMATRRTGVEMRVAIKFLLPGRDDDEFRKRFRAEMQILAILRHPNIVSLLDSGTTEEGRPYYVMEWIDGQPLTAYCASMRAPLAERLRLFRTVCDAVQYAHKFQLIHRDLKPANILVAVEGQRVKLLDFGIAKLIHPGMLGMPSIVTKARGTLLTLQYASPEQLSGGPLTTATDIYSLGVILYELLAGRVPFDPKDVTTIREYEEQVCEQEPLPVSRVVDEEHSRRMREPRPANLRRRFSGEIDHIVQKALRKEPDRRYETADQFADDINRFLLDLPVRAQPDSFGYRARKFVGRHRVGVGGATLAVTLLAAAMGAAVWQRNAAEAERKLAMDRLDSVRKLAHVFAQSYSTVEQSCLISNPALQGARQRERLLAANPQDTGLRRQLADAYGSVVQELARTGALAAAIQVADTGLLPLRRSIAAMKPADSMAAAELSAAQSLRDDMAMKLNYMPANGGNGFASGAATAVPAALAPLENTEIAKGYLQLAGLLRAAGDASSGRAEAAKAAMLLDGMARAGRLDAAGERLLNLAHSWPNEPSR